MKYKIVKETKPTLHSFGKYKAVACHGQTVETGQIIKVVGERGLHEEVVAAIMMGVSRVISNHLRKGHKVRLRDRRLMKLEIESDKVDDPKDFRAKKNIRGVRLHFLPESAKGKPKLYEDIKFEKDRLAPTTLL